jgi:hypothetical protein
MAGSVPANQQAVIDGLHKAMEFGMPNEPSQVLSFFKETSTTPEGVAVDQEGIPFSPDPADRVVDDVKLPDVPYSMKAADGGVIKTEFGDIIPARLTITLLEPDYQQVKEFAYVTASGVKYYYKDQEPVTALGPINVYKLNVETPQQA